MDFNFNMYIRQDAFILVPVLYIIGIFLRQTPFIPQWTYVWIKLTFAVISCLLYYGMQIQAVVQGILVTGAAVISRDLIHNTIDGMSGMKRNINKGQEKDTERNKNKE